MSDVVNSRHLIEIGEPCNVTGQPLRTTYSSNTMTSSNKSDLSSDRDGKISQSAMAYREVIDRLGRSSSVDVLSITIGKASVIAKSRVSSVNFFPATFMCGQSFPAKTA